MSRTKHTLSAFKLSLILITLVLIGIGLVWHRVPVTPRQVPVTVDGITAPYADLIKVPDIDGNSRFESFSAVKKKLLTAVYQDPAVRQTIYCHADFDATGVITLPAGFIARVFKNRTRTLEWEHVVPAEAFGRYFDAWHTGHPTCINARKKTYKGRACAEKVNPTYRHMQADMYNLYPAIGAVNAARQNYPFDIFAPDAPATFGSCAVKIQDKSVEVPPYARGQVARTYLYMDAAYHIPLLTPTDKKRMRQWDSDAPVTAAECHRAHRIEIIQGNENPFVKRPCLTRQLWPATAQ